MRTLLIFLLICSLSGCGTRKRLVHVEAVKKDVNLTQKNNISTNFTISRTQTSVIYTPVDPAEPMILPDGRAVINAKIEEKTEDVIEIQNTLDLSTFDWVSEFKTNKKDIDLKTEKANPYLWIYLAIGTVVALYLGYRYFIRR